MHFYTSINMNYLPKARILAKSVKQHCEGAKFSLVLSDRLPQEIRPEEEPFDEILTVEELGIPVKNLDLWIYMHTVVELCTAVKGQALVKFLEEGSEKVVYLDPDIAVFNSLQEVEQLLDRYDVLLTPHQTAPEKTKQDIINNEICSLKYGTYNFGFYAVKNSKNGLEFARWWRDRLVDFCYDDIPNGIFTDQRWGDLAPALFEGIYLLKDPGCNVSTWNITTRNVTEDKNGGYSVNGVPLKFYHFSGFDSGAQKTMLEVNGNGNPGLLTLREWYIKRMEEEGQKRYQAFPSAYNFYDNGTVVTKTERLLLRSRMDLLEYFADTNPFVTEQERSYYNWYRNEEKLKIEAEQKKKEEALAAKRREEAEKRRAEQEIENLNGQLQAIYSSKAWNYVCRMRHIKDRILKKQGN